MKKYDDGDFGGKATALTIKSVKRKEGGEKKQKEKNRRTKTGKQWRAMERINGNKLGN